MAIFKILHEGESIKSLKSTIKYNTDQKKDNDKKRLIGMYSNVGYCLNPDNPKEVQNLKNDFIDTVETNLLLNKAKRKQNKIYEHLTISFSKEDDKKHTQEELQSIALEMCSTYDPDFENTPFLLFPQNDSGKLHFHLVRGFNDQDGKSKRQYQSGRKMEAAAQKIEKKHNLTLTGKNNPNNWFMIDGKKTYIPQKQKNDLAYTKNQSNKNKELLEQYEEERQKIKDDFTAKKKKEIKLKRKIKSNSTFTELYTEAFDEDHKTEDLEKENAKYEATIKELNNKIDELQKENKKVVKKQKKVLKNDEKIKHHSSIEDFRFSINEAYRQNQTSKEFIEKLNKQGITIQYTERKNSNGGITFASDDFALAGGKVNSALTFGKLKKNNPELLQLITNEKPLSGFQSNGYPSKIKDEINIKELNALYKQFTTAFGETFIFYEKKDNEKYPFNYNLKINDDKTTISYGQNSNDYDLKLGYDLAKTNGWPGAISENKNLILNSMRVVFKENPEDLFFFKTKEKETLKLDEIKDIVKDATLSKNNLIILNDKNVIKTHQNDKEKEVYRDFLGEKLEKLGFEKEIVFELLDDGKTLEEILNDDYDTLKNQYDFDEVEPDDDLDLDINLDDVEIDFDENDMSEEELDEMYKNQIKDDEEAVESEIKQREREEQDRQRQREREREEYEPEPEPYRSKYRPRLRPY